MLLRVVGLYLRRLGEPLRSAFKPEAMRTLLAAHGFTVVHDDDIGAIGRQLSPAVAEAVRVIKHLRVVTADFG